MSSLYFLLCVGLAAAAAVEDKEPVDKASRSILLPRANCVAQWQSANPCVNNPLNKLNFPLPGDNSKFIQCGANARMFIVQCPAGELYDLATTTCIKATHIVAQPVYNINSYGVPNPCTAQNIAAGRIFFGLTASSNKFIQCSQTGTAQILTCPVQMVWNQNRLSCVFPAGTPLVPGTVGVGVNSLTGFVTTSNPCNAARVAANQLYYSHPDPSKFIQCDLHGHAFVQQCPSGLVWNQAQETCDRQTTAITQVATGVVSGIIGNYPTYINGVNGLNGLNGIISG